MHQTVRKIQMKSCGIGVCIALYIVVMFLGVSHAQVEGDDVIFRCKGSEIFDGIVPLLILLKLLSVQSMQL